MAGHGPRLAGVSMTAFQLAASLVVKSDSNLEDPTTINPRAWTCAVAPGPAHQGAGAVIIRWYRAHNS